MSFKIMAWASKQKVGKSTAKFVLLMLADKANDDGLCFPSVNKIADDCEITRPTVIKAIKTLEEKGLITIIHRNEDGVSLPNHYRLNCFLGGSKDFWGVVKNFNHGSKEILLGGSKEILHKPIIEEPIKESPPISPKGKEGVEKESPLEAKKFGKNSERIRKEFDMSRLPEKLHEMVGRWLAYKKYKYKPLGWESFVSQTLKAMDKHGADAVINRIEEAMSGEWMGVNYSTMRSERKQSSIMDTFEEF